MRILLDAQLPRSLVRPLEVLGCDVLHTLDLPAGNRSSDQVISAIADRDQRVVFNPDLTALLLRALPELTHLFESHVLIELSRKALVVRL
jgi:hypothetical protein